MRDFPWPPRHWLLVALVWSLAQALGVLVLAFAIAAGDIRGPQFLKMVAMFSFCATLATIDKLLVWQNAGIRWRVFAWAIGFIIFYLVAPRFFI